MIEDEVIVLGELSANGTIKQQFGNASFNRDGEDTMTTGDTFKSAGSDALKKCATEYGIALELYGAPVIKETSSDNGTSKLIDDNLATDKQINFLKAIGKNATLSPEEADEVWTAVNTGPSRAEAKEIIDKYGSKMQSQRDFPQGNLATDKQIAFLEKIAQRDDLTDEERQRIISAINGNLTKADAGELISSFARKRAQ